MAESEPSSQVLTNRLYDVLKIVAQIVLPALATLYFTLAQVWGWEHGAEVVASITAFDTFLGVLLTVSTKKYYNTGANFDGEVELRPDDGGVSARLIANKALEDMADEPGKHSIEFNIKRVGPDAS